MFIFYDILLLLTLYTYNNTISTTSTYLPIENGMNDTKKNMENGNTFKVKLGLVNNTSSNGKC